MDVFGSESSVRVMEGQWQGGLFCAQEQWYFGESARACLARPPRPLVLIALFFGFSQSRDGCIAAG